MLLSSNQFCFDDGIKQPKARSFETYYEQSKVEVTYNTTVVKPCFGAYKRELRD